MISLAAYLIAGLGASVAPGAAEAALGEARAALQRGDPARAAQAYAQAAAELPVCGDLEYDLGTAAAQAAEVGRSVLHLERALREWPWDAEARQNLEKIRQKRIDKVLGPEPGESPLQRLAAGLPGRLLFWVAVVAWWLGFLRWWRRGRFAAGSAGLLALALVSAGGALAWRAERQVPYGVVIGGGAAGGPEGVKVHAGPAGDLPSTFEVHEGLKVLLLDSENGFTHLRLGNGLEGFVPDGDVEAI